jgi:hypothetical protein
VAQLLAGEMVKVLTEGRAFSNAKAKRVLARHRARESDAVESCEFRGSRVDVGVALPWTGRRLLCDQTAVHHHRVAGYEGRGVRA